MKPSDALLMLSTLDTDDLAKVIHTLDEYRAARNQEAHFKVRRKAAGISVQKLGEKLDARKGS